ncbi:MAG: sugar phosphate isomerase/epimerase [Defluviitaleaceae bacterium]|nr:sugar phosphate isomerase/epimerase [Defluviitaleaceae bacterium]MCL2835441.1 sugar phosphate isomerase/epimerase [Defluviitaleaceae bacterium]
MKLGAQMYTVRDFCKTFEGFEESMGKVAAIGYSGVQLSPIWDYGADNIRKTADKYGLEIAVTHCGSDALLENTEKVISDHKVFGTKRIGIGSMPDKYRENAETVRQFISDYKPAAETLRKNGFRFMYHNHDFEFEKFDGKLMLDYLLDAFEAELLGIILDVFWVQAGGADPVFWIKKLKGRIETIHFKDYSIIAKQRKFAEVMEGNLNWDAIISACKETGVEWAVVEQDDCNGRDPFESLKLSFDNMKKAGL